MVSIRCRLRRLPGPFIDASARSVLFIFLAQKLRCKPLEVRSTDWESLSDACGTESTYIREHTGRRRRKLHEHYRDRTWV